LNHGIVIVTQCDDDDPGFGVRLRHLLGETPPDIPVWIVVQAALPFGNPLFQAAQRADLKLFVPTGNDLQHCALQFLNYVFVTWYPPPE
jgi:hypothetical protein